MITAAALIATIAVIGADKAKAEFASTGVEAETLGGKMKNALVFGAAAAGIAIVALAAESVKMAGDFQASMTRLVTSAGESQSNLQMVSNGILKMSVDTATSTEQLAQGMYFVESSGYHAAIGLAVMANAARGAKSENADLDVVSRALTTVLVDYHMKTGTAAQASLSSAQAMNGLIAAVQNGKTSLQDLSAAMGAVLPIGSALGISFPQIAGSIDTMTNAGMPAEQAAQNLAHVLVALSAPSKVATKSMQEVGLSAQQVKDALVHQGLPEALQLIEEHVGKKFPAGSVENVQALKNIMGGLVGVKLAAMLTGGSLEETKLNIEKLTAAMKDGKNGVMGWDDVQQTFNFKMDQAKQFVSALMISIGTKLLPVVGNLVSNIVQGTTAFINFVSSGHVVSDIMATISNNAQILVPILAGLAAGALYLAITSIPALVSALVAWAGAAWTAAAGMIAATWPVLAIIAAVAGLVAIFVALYQHNAQFKTFIDNVWKGMQQLWQVIVANVQPVWQRFVAWFQGVFLPAFQRFGAWIQANFLPAIQKMGVWFMTYVWPVLVQIGQFIAAQFVPIWQQLVQLWQGQLVPMALQLAGAIMPLWQSLQQLWAVIGPQLIPVLKVLGMIIGGVILLVIGELIGLITGLAKGIAGFIGGLATMIGGIVQMFTGVVQVISGIVSFLIDLFTGHFSKLGADLGLIWQGIINIFQGAWNTIAGIFQAAWGLIAGIVSGFVQGIIGFFQHLWNQLVGHSIIPDMLNSIYTFFSQMPGKIIGYVTTLVTNFINKMIDLRSQALAKITTFITDFGNKFSDLAKAALNWGANLINNFLSALKSAWNNVTAWVNNALNWVNSHFPHSPVKMGPLVGSEHWGENFVNNVMSGIRAATPRMQSAISDLTSSMALPLNSSVSVNGTYTPGGANIAPLSVSSGGGGGGQQPIIVNAILQVDGRMMANGLMPHIANAIRYGTGVHF